MADIRAHSAYFDARIKTFVVACDTSYQWYLDHTKGAEENLDIQRDIIRGRKTYQTLRADLKRGCVLPPVVLAVQKLKTGKSLREGDEKSNERTLKILGSEIEKSQPDHIQIIDGLQRTNALREAYEEIESARDKREFLDRRLRVEFWINIEFNALAYRMLLLNAGQKPMSMRHQLEILSRNLESDLKTVVGIEILRTLDHRRRKQPGQFQLSNLSQAFQAWLQGQPSIDIKNAVTEQLLSESAVDTLGGDLSAPRKDDGLDFHSFISWVVKVDNALGPNATQFLGNNTVLLGIAAAIGRANNKVDHAERAIKAMDQLLSDIKETPESDPAGIQLFEELRRGIDAKKKNVGEATRDLIFRAFQEYILNGGQKTMRECWEFSGSY